MDLRDSRQEIAQVIRIDVDKENIIKTITPTDWGPFLRYNYLKE